MLKRECRERGAAPGGRRLNGDLKLITRSSSLLELGEGGEVGVKRGWGGVQAKQ